jgi:hypothetical protein
MALSRPAACVHRGDMALSSSCGLFPDMFWHRVNWRASLRRADRACCCPARPSVVVIMPPTADRGRPADLLLCGHHFRVHEYALARAGAAVFDVNGVPLSPETLVLADG